MRTGQNIYKRRDGRWEARVFLGKKANGRPNFKYLYASTYREVLFQKNNYEKTISLKSTQILSTALFPDAAALYDLFKMSGHLSWLHRG